MPLRSGSAPGPLPLLLLLAACASAPSDPPGDGPTLRLTNLTRETLSVQVGSFEVALVPSGRSTCVELPGPLRNGSSQLSVRLARDPSVVLGRTEPMRWSARPGWRVEIPAAGTGRLPAFAAGRCREGGRGWPR